MLRERTNTHMDGPEPQKRKSLSDGSSNANGTVEPAIAKPKQRKRRRKLPKSLCAKIDSKGSQDTPKCDLANANTAAESPVAKPKRRKRRRKMPKSLCGKMTSNSSQDTPNTTGNSGLPTIKCDLPIEFADSAEAVEELMVKLLAEVCTLASNIVVINYSLYATILLFRLCAAVAKVLMMRCNARAHTHTHVVMLI